MTEERGAPGTEERMAAEAQERAAPGAREPRGADERAGTDERVDADERADAEAGAGADERSLLDRVYFPPEVGRLLGELSRALQKHAMYPPAHPALRSTVSRVWSALEPLLTERPELTLGIGRRRIAVADAETDPQNPVFSALASQLHGQELAAVTLQAGITENELADFLARVALDPRRSGRSLGKVVEAEGQPWRHAALEPLRYDALGLAWERGARSPAEEKSQADRLWLSLSRALLPGTAGAGAAGGGGAADGGEAPGGGEALADARGAPAAAPEEEEERERTPEELARAVEEGCDDETYARHAFQGLRAVSRELRSAAGGVARELQERTSAFVSHVDPDALRRMLGAGAMAERHALLRDAARWMEPRAVVKLARATGDAEERHLSNPLLLLMAKMARYATSEEPDVRAEAEAGLRNQVDRLVSGWERERSAPILYREALRRMAFADPELTELRAPTRGAEPEHVLRIGLLVDKAGPHVWSSVMALMQARRFSELLAALDGAPQGSLARAELWEELAQPRGVRWILEWPEGAVPDEGEEEPPDLEILDRFIARIGAPAAPPMLDAMAEAESRVVRQALFSRLSGMGPAIARHVLERLEDRRWRVRRDLLGLLGQVGGWPASWSPYPYSKDPHPAVRVEALKLLLRVRSQRDRAVSALLAEESPRARALGLAAAQREPPPEAAPLLLAVLEDEEAEPRLRILALRALARLRPPELPGPLLELAVERRGGLFRLLGPFRPRKLRPASPLMREALAALARGWRDAPEVRPVLERARRSENEAVRGAAHGAPPKDGPEQTGAPGGEETWGADGEETEAAGRQGAEGAGGEEGDQ